ncbi:MAG: acetyl-CoA carboxylase biotin carboxyl carrier protein [Bacteroidetes bacterium]|nr:acetyl-CoA carboxylase biotin carboxyl carrier protein [Bacteroidota bacterium]
MDLKQIQELIRFVSKSGVSEVKLEQGDFKITIKTTNEDEKKFFPQQYMMPQGMMMPQQQSAPAAAPAPQIVIATETPAAAPVASTEVIIKSPMIGTLYRKPSPDKPPFVQVGDKIVKGQVLCVIEAMKLFNEIEAEISGTIVKILADDTSPVEYDQPLFLVEPS